MAKNTIGQFIAALRKAKGMTQQDVANRLNVSNKAVSRWERDECAPDLSIIPAALIVSKMHMPVWIGEHFRNDEAVDLWTREDCWYTEYLWYALAVVVIVLIGFSLFETLTKKNARKQ